MMTVMVTWKNSLNDLLIAKNFDSHELLATVHELDYADFFNELTSNLRNAENVYVIKNTLLIFIDSLVNPLTRNILLKYIEARDIFVETCLSVLIPSASVDAISNCLWIISALLYFKPELIQGKLDMLSETILLLSLNRNYFKTSAGGISLSMESSLDCLLQRLYFTFPSFLVSSVQKIIQTLIKSENCEEQIMFFQQKMGRLSLDHLVFHSLSVPKYQLSTLSELTEFDDIREVLTSGCGENADMKSAVSKLNCYETETNLRKETKIMLDRSSMHVLQSRLASSRRQNYEAVSQRNKVLDRLENAEKKLETQELDNKRLLRTLQDVDSKNGDLKLKIDQISEDLFNAQESLSACEKLLIRTKDELNVEKKKSSNLSTENARIKAKIFEYCEIKNKLTRKVDSQTLVENQLQTLTKELFFMSEVHNKYEDKISKLQLDLRASNEDQLVILNYRRELNELRQKNKKMESKMHALEENLSKQQGKADILLEYKNEQSLAMKEQLADFEKTMDEYNKEMKKLRKLLDEKTNELETLHSSLSNKKLKDVQNTREKCVGTQ